LCGREQDPGGELKKKDAYLGGSEVVMAKKAFIIGSAFAGTGAACRRGEKKATSEGKKRKKLRRRPVPVTKR